MKGTIDSGIDRLIDNQMGRANKKKQTLRIANNSNKSPNEKGRIE